MVAMMISPSSHPPGLSSSFAGVPVPVLVLVSALVVARSRSLVAAAAAGEISFHPIVAMGVVDPYPPTTDSRSVPAVASSRAVPGVLVVLAALVEPVVLVVLSRPTRELVATVSSMG
jgi:hypothetical protein